MDLQIESMPGSREGIRVLQLKGPFTLPGTFEFQALMRNLNDPVIIVDLSDVPFMDSAALGAIMYMHASASRRKIRYAITGANERLRTMFQVGGVDEILTNYLSIADAEAALASKAACL